MFWLSCVVSNILLASVLGLMARFAQRRLRRPGLARALWVLALAKLITPPLVSVPLGELPASISCAAGLCGCDRHAARLAVWQDVLPWALFALWSVGAGVTGCAALRRYVDFRRLMVHAVPASSELQSLAARLSAELSLRRPPNMVVLPCRLPPLVVAGWHGPRVLVPRALMTRLDDSQREALLLHELLHIQRRDHLVRLLELTVSVVYWWLPVLASVGRQLRECEEACCDAAVLDRLPHARREYARLLLDVLDFVAPLPPAAMPQATAMSAVHDLEQRLRTILDGERKRRSVWPAYALAIGVSCTVLPCGFGAPSVTTPALATSAREPAEQSTGWSGGEEYCDPPPVSAVLCCPS